MTPPTPPRPNPKRVAAGRLNRQKRLGLTLEGRERLRQAALQNEPWRHATGPRTLAGKARAARNGKVSQKGPRSVREIQAELAELRGLLGAMQESRRLATGALGTDP